jgi:hypothetical protein
VIALRPSKRSLAALGAILFSATRPLAPAPTAAAVLVVAAGGVDVLGCGTPSLPCRRIGKAIAFAAPGDTIAVEPGEYADNRPVPCGGAPPAEAQICIDKRVQVVSRAGATATVIRRFDSTPLIRITAPGVRFGSPAHGFTVIGASDGIGLSVDADHVRIEGNLFTGSLRGMELRGEDASVAHNFAHGNSSIGFQIVGSGRVRSNTASGNGKQGFALGAESPGTLLVSRNVAVANGDCGFLVDGGIAGEAIRIVQNAAIGNGTGIRVARAASNVRLTRNNLYANATNCGLQLQLGAVVLAPRNFFGGPGGAGGDPADAVCGASEGTSTVPYALGPFRVKGVGAVP